MSANADDAPTKPQPITAALRRFTIIFLPFSEEPVLSLASAMTIPDCREFVCCYDNILTKFKRDLFKKRIKSASKNNLFFFKTRSNINKFERLSQKKEKRKIPHQNMCDKKSKKLLKNLEKLNIYTNREKNNFKKNEIKIDINNIKYFSKHFEEKKHFDKKIDEQFKKNVVEYQKEIGKFFIYKGNWIYSSHLNTLLKADKIAQNIVKFDNL